MADNRAKAVFNEIAPLYARTQYLMDLVRQLREPLGMGDAIDCPSLGALTVTASGTTGASPQSVTTNALTCTANLDPAIFSALPKVDQIQLANGDWVAGVARDSVQTLKNHNDNLLARDYLARTVAYATTALYHDNVAGDALSGDDVLNCRAKLLANDGVMLQNLAMFVHPFGEGSIMSIDGFVPNYQAAEQGFLGIPRVGSVYGIPVYTSNSVLSNHTAVTTAAVTSGSGVTHTYTVAAGHGFVPGQLVTVSGHDAHENIATPTAITSVTATTIVVTTDATTDGTSSDADGLITDATCWNLMMDLSQVFVAQQVYPEIRILPMSGKTVDEMQTWALWGRVARTGRVRVFHSPGSTVA